MKRLPMFGLYALTTLAALWVLVATLAYPSPPARPSHTSGGGFRVEREGQHVTVLHGTPYALGAHNTRLFQGQMRQQEDTLLDLLFGFTGGAAKAMLVRQLSLLYLTGLDDHLTLPEREEILGLAEGSPDPFPDLGPRYARIASYHAIHELSQRFAFDHPLFACSLIAVGKARGQDGHTFLARNFDFEGGDVFDQDKVVLAVRPNEGYGFVSVSWAGMAGVVSGMNEAGLAITINAGASADYNRVGAPTTLLVRRALEHGASIDDAVRILTSAPRFVTDIIGLADRSGRVAVLELGPNHHALREGDLLVATNHLEAPEFTNDPVNVERQHQTTTLPRRARLEALAKAHTGPINERHLLDILRDSKSADGSELPIGHRHAIDALIATHSVIFDTTSGMVWISRGPQTLGPYLGYDVRALVHATTPDEVVRSYRPALPGDPREPFSTRMTYARAQWHHASAALKAHDLERAQTSLNTVPSVARNHPTTLMLEGELALARGDRARAEALLARAKATPLEYEQEAAKIDALLAPSAPQ